MGDPKVEGVKMFRLIQLLLLRYRLVKYSFSNLIDNLLSKPTNNFVLYVFLWLFDIIVMSISLVIIFFSFIILMVIGMYICDCYINGAFYRLAGIILFFVVIGIYFLFK